MWFLFLATLIFTVETLANDNYKIDENAVRDKEHLHDHAKDESMKKSVDNMTNDELEMFYFYEHDRDNNKLLDGNELMMAILEHMTKDKKASADSPEPNRSQYNETEFKQFITNILEFDNNNDGYLDLKEFRTMYSH